MNSGFLLFLGLLLLWMAFTGRAENIWQVIVYGSVDNAKLDSDPIKSGLPGAGGGAGKPGSGGGGGGGSW